MKDFGSLVRNIAQLLEYMDTMCVLIVEGNRKRIFLDAYQLVWSTGAWWW